MNHCISRLSRAVLLALPLAAGAPRRGRSQERHLLPGRRHGSGHRDRRPHLQGRKAACRPARLAGQPGARQPFHAAAALRRPHQDLFAGWPDHRQRPVHGRLHDRREDAQRGHFHVGRHGGRGRRGQAIRLGRRQHLPPTNGTPAQTLLELAKAKGRAVGAVSTTRVGHATPATTYAHVCNRNGYNTIAEQSTPGHANYNTRLGDGIDVLLGGGQRNYLPAAQPGQQAHRRRQSGDGLPGQGLYLRRYGHRCAR